MEATDLPTTGADGKAEDRADDEAHDLADHGADDGAQLAGLAALRALPRAVWLRVTPYAAVAALAIGIPSDLIDTPVFGRPVPVRPIDYLIWAVTSLLIGLVFAIRREPSAGLADGTDPAGPDPASGNSDQAPAGARDGGGDRAGAGALEGSLDEEAGQTRAIWGGFVSFLSVGCPVCNQAVVALVGTSGALSWWAPIQPLVGLAAVALLVVALRTRLRTYRLTSCPLPAA